MTAINSPCINVCRMQDNLCLGCYRTLDEIATWSQMSDAEKKQVLSKVANRSASAVENSAGVLIRYPFFDPCKSSSSAVCPVPANPSRLTCWRMPATTASTTCRRRCCRTWSGTCAWTGDERVAVAVDMRGGSSIAALPPQMRKLEAEGVDATLRVPRRAHEVLIQRFSETRRRHPLAVTT
jgi:predicted Fe-S protein YdhL (DUF1289 family)